MADKAPKTVNLVTTNAFKHDGKHYAVGDLLTNVDAELALDLTGSARTRLATEDDLAAVKKSTAKQQPAA